MEKNPLELLKERPIKLCVLATSSKDAQPWCSVMGYAIGEDGTIILSTLQSTKKWKNLEENNKVALLIGWDLEGPSIHCEGKAQLVTEGELHKKTEELFFTQNPYAAKFKTTNTMFVIIKPTFMRLTDYGTKPPTVKEYLGEHV